MSNKKIEDNTKLQIAAFLPQAMMQALATYHEFMIETPREEADSKKFAAHQNACKVAVAHIELLVKLARMAGLPDADAADHSRQIAFGAMLQEAEEEVERFREVVEIEE